MGKKEERELPLLPRSPQSVDTTTMTASSPPSKTSGVSGERTETEAASLFSPSPSSSSVCPAISASLASSFSQLSDRGRDGTGNNTSRRRRRKGWRENSSGTPYPDMEKSNDKDKKYTTGMGLFLREEFVSSAKSCHFPLIPLWV